MLKAALVYQETLLLGEISETDSSFSTANVSKRFFSGQIVTLMYLAY
jgi:hypothetical protein